MASAARVGYGRGLGRCLLGVCLAGIGLIPIAYGEPPLPTSLEISRPVRPWEFLSVLGTRAGVLGVESGSFEVWAYPLKILRGFHLTFLSGGRRLPADAFARSIVVRPESTTLVYVSDTFSVRETIFVPRAKAGAVVRLEIDTSQPLEVEADFRRDLQLEWPAPLGGASIDYVPRLNAFVLGEPEGRFTALVGSPSGHDYQEEYDTRSFSMPESSLKLGPVARGTATQMIAIAGSSNNHLEAEALYRDLLTHAVAWQDDDAALYRRYIAGNLRLTLPDGTLQRAYEWAQVSMLQGVIENPFLGTGLVAGYGGSGDGARPGYAWFFGRDAMWTALALTSEGDFATARTAIAFLAKYQRVDGKVPHEIAQGATFVPWFTKLPYAYASADATPLLLIATDDYVTRSGDIAFAREMWDKLWSAYQFVLSTYDQHGLARNGVIGHGWIEGGPLFPLEGEAYQSGVALESTRALAHLAEVLNKTALSRELAQTFDRRSQEFEDAFWMPSRGHYALGIDRAGQQVDVTSVLATVPMWFGLLKAERAESTLTELSGPEHATDWGMRILSEKDARFDPSGYHWGTVWPLFTGWASVAEYRYHRPVQALENLETNALLTFDGAAGHVAEVLSGSYYETLETGSPNQIWSSAMVVSPLVHGLLGLTPDAVHKTLRFAPHVPAEWSSFRAENVRVGAAQLSLEYSRTGDLTTLIVRGTGEPCLLTFAPALSLRAHVRSVSLNGKRVPFHVESNANDRHVETVFPVKSEEVKLTMRVEDDFGLSAPATLPSLGESSHGAHVISETWSDENANLALKVTGAAGRSYELGVWQPGQISSLEGAKLIACDGDHAKLRVDFAGTADAVETQSVVIHFGGKAHRWNSARASTANAQERGVEGRL